MVTGWRRAFCTSIPKDREPKVLTEKQQQHCDNTNRSPKFSSKFSFFSTPSTPRSQSQPVSTSSLRCRTPMATGTPNSSVPNSPKLQCNYNAKTPKKPNSPRLFQLSNPPSPKSPSSFSLLKASLRISKSRCGICMQSVKSGQGTAIFTAECSHTFHFPCIAAHVKKQQMLICPVCSTNWKELPVLTIHTENQLKKAAEENRAQNLAREMKTRNLKLYNDDEPLMSPTSVARFNPIPESDENEDQEEEEEPIEFQGFNVNPAGPAFSSSRTRSLEFCLLPEAAIVAANRNYETYVVVLKLKAPPSMKVARRAPMDLVTVLDVGGAMSGSKLRIMKHSMRVVISSLGPTDRLSIVAFSAGSKRLLPLRRMTGGGQRSARRIVDALAAIDQAREGAFMKNDALKKAAKILEDRREKNPVASIIILSDIQDERVTAVTSDQNPCMVSSTRFSHLEIPVHTVKFPSGGDCVHAQPEDAFARCVAGMLNVVAQDLRLQLGILSRSLPADIAAVYSLSGQPAALVPGSALIGDVYAEEEREFLVELKVPAAAAGSHHIMSVRSSYRDPSTQELVHRKEQALLIPRPNTVRSSCPRLERLRNLHITARAVAESRRLIEHSDLSGAHHLLSSARALLMQSNVNPAGEFLRWLEAEQAELQRGRQLQLHSQRPRNSGVDEKIEPLTPTSAWRAAERLAKVAIMRKSMNRVSDLHGFENARF